MSIVSGLCFNRRRLQRTYNQTWRSNGGCVEVCLRMVLLREGVETVALPSLRIHSLVN